MHLSWDFVKFFFLNMEMTGEGFLTASTESSRLLEILEFLLFSFFSTIFMLSYGTSKLSSKLTIKCIDQMKTKKKYIKKKN